MTFRSLRTTMGMAGQFAVRRASNQFFYIQNSSKSNFNSSNGDGIRVNFGREEADIRWLLQFDEWRWRR